MPSRKSSHRAETGSSPRGAALRTAKVSTRPARRAEPNPPPPNRGVFSLLLLSYALWLAFLGWMAFTPGPESDLAAPPAVPAASTETHGMRYPATRRLDQVDQYHGAEVPDPYRWLEEIGSEEVRRWVAEQNRFTRELLGRAEAAEEIRRRLTELWNYERFSQPVKRGPYYFYTRNDGLQNQAVLLASESLDGVGRVLLDPNELSAEGTVALAGWEPSENGEYLAYALRRDGSDWETWRVLETATGRQMLDEVRWVKFSHAAWSRDSRGFYYGRYAEPNPGEEFRAANYHQKLYYHTLGDPQYKDQLIYERPEEKEWGFGADVSEDGRFLLITVWRGTERKTQVFVRDLDRPRAPVRELITGFDADYDILGAHGTRLFLLTDHDAPRRRVVSIDLLAPGPLEEIIPENEETLASATYAAGHLFAIYLHHAASRVEKFDEQGRSLGEVELPALGTAGGFRGRRDDAELFFAFTSFTTPNEIYRYDVTTGRSELFRRPHTSFEPRLYETRQVFVSGNDGIQVPMFLIARRDLPPGPRPALLTAYGGFNISIVPRYSPADAVWLEMGGLMAVANLRGGGEYGREWHEAGMLEKKQNVFDDFLACAEWLIAEGHTTNRQLAIEGRSNGGLLVGAVLTQRPELFGAAVPAVGVLDMLRYHHFTIGWAWVPEYGSADDPKMFPVLHGYSPLHNIVPGTEYPATMIVAADTDDRVVPAHSYKFGAALQAAQGGEAPILLRIETSAGHGAGVPTSKKIEEMVDIYSFLTETLRFSPEWPK